VREVIGISILVLMAVATVATVALVLRGRDDPRYRRLLPAVAVTGAGMCLLVASYLWWLELGQCQSRNQVVCVVNANQGFLTLLALLLAAAGVWATLITSETVRYRAGVREAEHGRDTVRAALQELHHNLIHVSLACDGHGKLLRLPMGLSLDATRALCDPLCHGSVDRRLVALLDPMSRNFQRLMAFEQEWRNAKAGAAHQALHERLEREPKFLTGFVNNTIRFAIRAWVSHSDWCDGYLGDGFQDVPALVEATGDRSYWMAWRSSEIEEEDRADIRNRNIVLATWIDDDAVGVQTFAFGPRFADRAKSHRRHS
jgi:hypothetical protein